MSRYAYVQYSVSQVIGITPGYRETMLAREESVEFEKQLERKRKTWKMKPPSPFVITLHTDVGAFPGGVVLSVPHEVGRMLLHKKLATILERDLVTVDAVITGDLEEAVEAMGLVSEVVAV